METSKFFIKSEVAGSYTDFKFDDLQEFRNHPTTLPRGIKVRAGDVIDSIEMIYDKSDYPTGKSPYFHGGPNGYDNLFMMPPGDFIRKIDLEYGKYPYSTDPEMRKKDQIIRIRFTTNRGIQSPWYGNACGKGSSLHTKPFTIDAGESNIICCFFGATGKKNMELHNYLQALGVYMISFIDLNKCGLKHLADQISDSIKLR